MNAERKNAEVLEIAAAPADRDAPPSRTIHDTHLQSILRPDDRAEAMPNVILVGAS